MNATSRERVIDRIDGSGWVERVIKLNLEFMRFANPGLSGVRSYLDEPQNAPDWGASSRSRYCSRSRSRRFSAMLNCVLQQTGWDRLQLHFSPKTVAAHRMHITERLNIHNLAGLVIYALRKKKAG